MRCLRSKKCLPQAVALAVLALPSAAQAQASLALDRLDPAPAGDRMFGVPSPFAAGELTPHVMLLGDYSHNPFVLRSDPGNRKLGAVVRNQLYLNLDVGLALWNRLNLDLDVPVALLQNGDAPSVGAQAFGSPTSAEFGDLRFGVRLRLAGEYHDPFQIAVGGYLWAPTGAKHSFVGSGQARTLPQLILGGRVAERLVWSAAAGPEFQSTATVANVEQGSMFKWGAGLGVLLLDNRHLQIGPEIFGSATLRDVQKRTTNAELLFDARYRIVDDVEIAAGAGPGLTTGIGTPDFRGVFSLAYTPEQKPAREAVAPPETPLVVPSDRDQDGIVDAKDACPDDKGVADPDPKKNGCPPDRDEDGILDADDACPDFKGPRTEDPKTNGCPPDRDGDGILDAQDACPDEKGLPNPDPSKNGCPPKDSDGDGILDPEDACPHEKGVPNADPDKNGCPRAVRVTETEIVILEQVQFDTGKANIKGVSDQLLDEVAEVLTEHPEITKIEVQGHTDNRGAPAFNRTLSQGRANAVTNALHKRGVAADRLSAKGYGLEQPIADNTTDEGRQKNRRVQFVIVTKLPKGTN